MQTGTKVTVNFLIFSGSKPAIQSESILGLGSGYLYILGASSDRRVFKIVKPIASLTRALKQSVKLYKIIKSNNITRKAHRELVKFFNDLLGESNLGMYF